METYIFIHTPLVTVYFNKGKFDRIDPLYMEMKKRGINADSAFFGYIVKLYGKAGRVDDVLRWIKEAKSLNVCGDSVYRAAVSGLHSFPDRVSVESTIDQLLSEMSKEGYTFKRDTLPRSSFSSEMIPPMS